MPSWRQWDGTAKGTYRPINESDRKENPLPDDQTTSWALSKLHSLAEKGRTGEEPFFLSVGYFKPHLPFLFPEHYQELYPENNISLPENRDKPKRMPKVSVTGNVETSVYSDIRGLHLSRLTKERLPDHVAKQLRRGYYSCVTYIDSLIGQVMDTLDTLSLTDSTVVTLVGDHGWQLGEHTVWGKRGNFDLALRTPLIIRAPGITKGGTRAKGVVELLDVYPTLVEAAGLDPVPSCGSSPTPEGACTEGNSLVPMLSDPSVEVKDAAYSQWFSSGSEVVMGYSIRNRQYRYTEWVGFSEGQPNWGSVKGRELYDHDTDPGETDNRAHLRVLKSTVHQLSDKLRKKVNGINS